METGHRIVSVPKYAPQLFFIDVHMMREKLGILQ